jgi:hypothetical protein
MLLTVAAAACLAAIVAWYWQSFPIYAHRYRLTVAVEVDGEVHTGSSVIEIRYHDRPRRLAELFLAGRRFSLSVHGQAVLVELGTRGALVAVLRPSSDREAVPANWLALEALGPRVVRMPDDGCLMTADGCFEFSRLQGRADLRRDNLPQFIWLKDIADPSTAQPVKPADFARVIGGEAGLASAQVEITRDPIVIDIDKKLPWYNSLEHSQRSLWAATRVSEEFQLADDMFVGGGE